MLFTSLKATGFKSFAETQQISIHDGMTGIVGPNGCGKSNIVESFRWLMGESSAQSMRAGDRDDIIFAGSASAPMRHYAEVVLSLDNSRRDAPSAFNDAPEIEVSRRLERGKGSSFKINGRPVLSRDVRLLFADLSTGSRSSGIVNQGQVGQLIAAKPLERRHLLEEAANIQGLHQRRHDAELRLNTAAANLLRLEDVLHQLEEQKRALVAQARQAARYRSIAERLRKSDAHLLLARFAAAALQLSDLSAQLREAERLMADAAAAAAAKNKIHSDFADMLPALRAAEAEKASALQRLSMESAALDSEESRAKQALAAVVQRQRDLAADTAREDQLSRDAAAALAALAGEIAILDAADSGAAAALAEASSQLSAAEAAANNAASSLADIRAQSQAAAREKESAARRVADLTARLDEATKAFRQLGREQLQEAANNAAADYKASAQAAAAAKDKAASIAKSLQDSEQALAISRQALQQAQDDFGRLNAEVEALQSLLVSPDDEAEPVSASIIIDGGFEDALAAVLGDSLSAPIAPESPKSNKVFWRDDNAAPPIVQPDNLPPLAPHIGSPKALAAALSGVGIASNQAEAYALQSALTPGQAITTIAGGLWRWDGLVQPPGAEGSAATRLKQTARLRQLKDDLGAAKTKLQTASTAYDGAAAATNSLRTQLGESAQSQQKLDDQLMAALKSDEAAKAAYTMAAQRYDELMNASQSLAAEKTVAEQDLASLADGEALAAEITKLSAAAEETRQNLTDAMGQERAISTAAAQRKARRDSITNDHALWLSRKENAGQRLAALAERAEQTEQEKTELSAQPALIAQRRGALSGLLAAAAAARDEAAAALSDKEAQLHLASTQAREAEQIAAKKREDTIRIEAQRDIATQEQQNLVIQIDERLAATPDELRGLAGLEAEAEIAIDSAAIASLEERHRRLLRERENIGPVNLRAEEEMTELEERLTALTAERDDLTAAVDKLRLAISQLNREGRTRLLKSFADVNRHFSRLFKSLFGGGHAELTLTETDDPLAAGLEIMARPPGKHLQTLSLLSGGEQALTALALIFAIFSVNPSPICILDEVDAPLDDTNVSRFCDMLDHLVKTSKTRFIIITHHRLTMARMDRLYGVTMEKQGISRIVSVDLQTAEHYKDLPKNLEMDSA